MKFLSREEILKAQDVEREVVPVPEWGGDVLLQGGTGDDRDAFEGSIMSGKGKDLDVNTKRLRVKLLARAIVDEDGNRVFTEEDVEALARKNARIIERLFKVAQKLWGLTKQDVEELVGELKPGQNAGHGTDSPGNGASPALAISSES